MAVLLKKNILIFLYFVIIIKFTLSTEVKNKNIIRNSNDKNISFINYKSNTFANITNKNYFGNIYTEDPKFVKGFYKKIFIIFISLSTISIILIFIDLYEDKKIARKYNSTLFLKANEEYKKLKNTFIIQRRILFALFLFKYIYPLLSIFYVYNYDFPRHIRFVIINIKLCINVFFTVSIYYYMIYFIDNIEYKALITTIIFFVFSALLIMIIDLIIRYLLNYDEKRRNIFKPRLENLRKYVYYGIKKDILFNSKWHSIRNRILSYYRICGPSILINKKLDKYGIYVNNKIMNYNRKLANNSLSFNTKLINEDKDSDINNNNRLTEKLLSTSNNSKDNLNNIKNNNDKLTLIKDNSKKMNDSNNFDIVKGTESFSLTKFGINNLKLKTVKKIEDIRNRYIINKNEIKYDETLDVNSNVRTFENLEIEALENYTYISTDKIINAIKKLNSNSNKILINIFINFILLLFLFLSSQGLLLIYGQKKNKSIDDSNFYFGFLIIFIFDFLLYAGISILLALILPRCYGKKKKKCYNKLIFKLFIEKYILYLYKMRLLLNKYHKEFEFFEK